MAWAADVRWLAIVLVALIVVAATLESVFAICLGCIIFARLMRWGVIPASVCESCGDISGRLTAASNLNARAAAGPSIR